MINIQKIGLIAGPVVFLVLQQIDFVGLPPAAHAILSSTAWVAIWWITEALPMSVTAFLPIVLFPLTGGLDIKTTTTTYFSPIIVLFLGAFIIAIAIEKWNLHIRIALNIIKFIGTKSNFIVLGFMVATAFLSMWISNTATTLMMLPIGLAITKTMGKFQESISQNAAFNRSLMLAIAYGASIGGMATLIGTPTNAVFSAISLELYGQEISFLRWFLIGLPVSIVLVIIGWQYLTRIVFKSVEIDAAKAKEATDRQLKALGAMSYEEKVVAIIFFFTAVAWILRSFVLSKFIDDIDDTIIAITSALVLFLIPARGKGKMIMDWKSAEKLPWGVLILFGGGLAIAVGFGESGLAGWLGERLTALQVLPFALILLLLVLLVNFFTEITSNVATAAVLLPILGSLALSIGVHPYGLMAGASLAASCAFMLPVATPPNAIVYSSGYLDMKVMVRVGFAMNLISVVVVFLVIYFLMPIIWGIDLMKYPF